MEIAIIKDNKLNYDSDAPFNPSQKYPEYPFKDISQNNIVYDSVRRLLFMLGMDRDNYGRASWNPLGEMIRPGDSVLLKPNLVRHRNPAGETVQLLTHGSIIRAVLDYVYIALKGKGKITIGEAPLQSGDFEKASRIAGIDKIIDFYSQNCRMGIGLVDFRREAGECNRIFRTIERRELDGDPSGYTAVDLKDDSELFEIINDYEKFRVVDYAKSEMVKHHNKSTNEYLVPNSILNADVIINLPKLKTHQKAGMTCALKNLIGINGAKDWLPHYRVGSPEEGGDEFLHKSYRKRMLARFYDRRNNTANRFYSALISGACLAVRATSVFSPFKDQYFQGGWYGNDTIPRTIVDLNKIVFYADKNGVLSPEIQRKMFTIVDAVIAGEKEGPLEPAPKNCGVLVAGYNPVAVDLVCSRIMGLDDKKIPTFKYALGAKRCKLFDGKPGDIRILSDKCSNLDDVYGAFNCDFAPPSGWKGHIEYNRNREETPQP